MRRGRGQWQAQKAGTSASVSGATAARCFWSVSKMMAKEDETHQMRDHKAPSLQHQTTRFFILP